MCPGSENLARITGGDLEDMTAKCNVDPGQDPESENGH